MTQSQTQMGIIQQINSLQERLDKCANPKKMIPMVEEFLGMLYRITGKSKLELEERFAIMTERTGVRNTERGSKQKTNPSRIGRAGTGKDARSKKQQNSERKLNETFSL